MSRRANTQLARQAADELSVYTRMMNGARRRWAQRIARHEGAVRRCMVAEEQCRERLRRSVLRTTLHHLKFLVNTDLLSAAQVVSPPAVETFVAYNIAPTQLSAFSVYAMAHIRAHPDRLATSALTWIAELQSAWRVLPQSKKAAYAALAEIFRGHLLALQPAPQPAKHRMKRKAQAEESKRPARGRAVVLRVARERVRRQSPSRRTGNNSSGVRTPLAAERVRPSVRDGGEAHATRWDERAAFARFAAQSLRQTRAALAAGERISARQWAPIAQAEWAAMSLRQRRHYRSEAEDDGDDDA